MGAFAGYLMPLFYPLGMLGEHLHTREKAGLFDISHMVHVEVTGEKAGAMIERLCPYPARDQAIGSCRYTFFLNKHAGVIDDLIITRLDPDRYLIVANAACAAKDIALLNSLRSKYKVSVEIRECAFIALQGPLAGQVLMDVGFDTSDLTFMHAREPKKDWFVSRTGYTGEDGFEIALPVGKAAAFIGKLVAHQCVELIGLAARDTLRMEAGLSLYGQDLTDDITPHEADLLWAIPKSCRDGGSFIGAAALSDLLASGRKRKRVGFVPKAKSPVRTGADLLTGDGILIGQVTSGGFSPSLNHPIALGLIAAEADQAPIFAKVRGQSVEMTPTSLPFVPHRYKR